DYIYNSVLTVFTPASRDDALPFSALLVLHRRDDTGRLVQGEGHLGLVELEPDTVDVDDGGGRVDPGAELDHPAVHRDTAVDDERSEEHTSELQSRENLVCRLLLEK